MGLSYEGSIPRRMQPVRAYEKIYDWYTGNIELARRYADYSVSFITSMPSPDVVTDDDIFKVFDEVIQGKLEWGYHGSDGKYKMAAYVHAATRDRA